MTLILSGTNGLSDVDGSAATPAVRGTDANTGMFFPAADTIAFAEGGVEAMRLDAAGNMGLGVTPSAWGSDTRALQIFNRTSLSDLQSTTQLTNNGHWNGSSWAYRETAAAGNYNISGNTHVWRIAPSGTAGNAITFTQAMTLDASGRLAVGATDPQRLFDARGAVNLSNTSPSVAATSGAYADIHMRTWTGASSSPARISVVDNWMDFVSTFTDGFRWFNYSSNGVLAERARIDSSGGFILAGSTAQKATGTTWSNPSDQRLKDNIRGYNKGVTELMQVRVCEWEYNGKGGTVQGTKGLGVVADEVMAVLPDTVSTYDAKLNTDDEEVTAIKKFDATEITWLLVKTVQEQQAMIEQLKADVAALKGDI